MNHHLYFPKSFNFVFSFCVFTCSSYVQLHCLAQLSDWTHFHFLGTVFTDPLGYWVSDWKNEWMNELARIPIRAMASCLAGIPWEDLARGASGGERGVLVYVGVSFGCSSMMTIFVPFMSTVHVPIFPSSKIPLPDSRGLHLFRLVHSCYVPFLSPLEHLHPCSHVSQVGHSSNFGISNHVLHGHSWNFPFQLTLLSIPLRDHVCAL